MKSGIFSEGEPFNMLGLTPPPWKYSHHVFCCVNFTNGLSWKFSHTVKLISERRIQEFDQGVGLFFSGK